MSLVFCVLVDVFLRKAAEKDAVETRVESVQVGSTHMTDTRLGQLCPSRITLKHLASPGLSSTTPNKALVYDSKVLFPIVHLITVHMGAPGRTHDRQNIQFGFFLGDNETSPGWFT